MTAISPSARPRVRSTPFSPKAVLVTGGAGFIGSAFIRGRFRDPSFRGEIVNVDAMTYAGNHESLDGHIDAERYTFVRGDVRDGALFEKLFAEHAVDCVVHFAAESHVDRSIHGPRDFVETNVLGTFAVLEAVRASAAKGHTVHFHHVSTDEVFGSLGETGFFVEETPYDPRSPYSASKAASDHFVRAYAHTYQLPITVSNCSNNYGPCQFPEKLIPLMIENCLEGKPLPVYGDGQNVRDWLYVDDHVEAIWAIVTRAAPGTTWNVGGKNEWKNLELLEALIDTLARVAKKDPAALRALITFVPDRPGHDRRYAIDCSLIERELGWRPKHDFRQGLEETVRWYLEHRDWVERVKSGAYKTWIERNYASR